MRKRTRYLRLFVETIDGEPTAKIGRSVDHPEDTVKLLAFDPEEDRPHRTYILEMPVSRARRLAARLEEISR